MRPGKHIYQIEDDEAIGELLALALSEDPSYYPRVVADAHEALRVSTSMKVDLFVIDYYLAGMNGIELYEQLQKREKLHDVPALILSASLEKHEKELRERNLLGLKKPFELDELLQTIAKVLVAPSKR